MSPAADSFTLPEATIEDIHAAYTDGRLTARQLVQMYIDRIEAYDRGGPRINSIITVNPAALEEADRLDAAFKSSGKAGPLHGIPVLIKDQADLKGTPTTLGSLVFKDYYPDRDCRVVEKLKEAGAIVLAKTTLGELGAGDTHGSLFGSTRNPYDVERTVGGSSGGSGAAVSANFGTVGIGQEGLASIRRPSTWNCIAGMRPTAGLVSRSGVYSGWPQEAGSLGPMARTVRDMAVLLDVMVGYDGDDPITSRGVGHAPPSYTDFLDAEGLRGARIGILRTPMGYNTDPEAEDFKSITGVLDNAVEELRAAGAEVVDPVELARLNELLATRCANPTAGGDGLRDLHGPERQPAVPDARGGHAIARVRQALGSGQGAPASHRRPRGPLPVPAGPGPPDDPPAQDHGRAPAGRHRPQGRGTPAHAHRRRCQAALREPQGRAAPEHVRGIRAHGDGARGIHPGRPPRRHQLPRTAL